MSRRYLHSPPLKRVLNAANTKWLPLLCVLCGDGGGEEEEEEEEDGDDEKRESEKKKNK